MAYIYHTLADINIFLKEHKVIGARNTGCPCEKKYKSSTLCFFNRFVDDFARRKLFEMNIVTSASPII